jgi:hypothetical protein
MRNAVKNLTILLGILLIVAFVLVMRFMATESTVTAPGAYHSGSEQARTHLLTR